MAKKKSTGKSTGSRTTTRKSEARVKSTRGGTSSSSKGRSSTGRKAAGRSKTSSSSSSSSSKKKGGLGGANLLARLRSGIGNGKSTRRKSTRSQGIDWRPKGMALGFALVAGGVLAVLGLLSTNRGYITGGLLDLLWSAFGWGMPLALAALILGGFWLVLWGIRSAPAVSPLRLVGGLLLFFAFETFATIIAFLRDNGLESYEAVLAAQVGGGWVGYLATLGMTRLVGMFGTIFVATVVGVTGVAMFFGMRWVDIQELLAREEEDGAPAQGALPLFERRTNEETAAAPESEAASPPPPLAGAPLREQPAATAEPESGRKGRSRLSLRKKPAEEKAKPAPRQPAPPQPIFLGRDAEQIRTWQLPTLPEMLNLGSDTTADNTHVHNQALIIEETLNSFGAPGQVVDIRYGPTIIQYCVEPRFLVQRSGKRTKVKVGKIASLADDLALALAARSVRIQAPVPGRAYVGIEVPNEAKSLVSLRDVMESDDFTKLSKKSLLTVGLGEDVAGQPLSIDLTKMPHMLIAGATGSGKSVCVNAIIACLLLRNTPEDLKLVMVDPKRVELTGYNGIPHLAAPVVVDMERVVGTLQWAMREMDNRYQLFSESGARNIDDYNKKAGRHGRTKLPNIVIIIDELADLMMIAPEETERAIARLAQMARATGIHMILATQRPSVDVVTGLIKANFPARIAFAVASSTDSRVVLDTTGAERLLGQGDMLFQSPDAPAPVRMQGCFVSDGELNKIIDYWKSERRRASSSERTTVITAESDAVPKAELAQEVWDGDTEQEKEAKRETLDQIRVEQARPAPKTSYTDEAPADADPQIPDDIDEEEEAARVQRRRQAAASRPTSPPRREPPPAAAVKPEPAPETEPEEEEDDTPPLWEDLHQELVEEQERAILARQFGEDEHWDEAVAMVREMGKASTSLLQRRFRIGYTRAARMIDRMEEEGIISPMLGNNQAREVIDPEE